MLQRRLGLATAVACLFVLVISYINAMPVRLTSDQEQAITASYRDRYLYLFDVKAMRSVFRPDLVTVAFKGQISHDQWPERVEVKYQLTSQTEIASKRLTGSDTVLAWGLNLAAIVALAVFGGAYLLPLVSGRYCPHCRKVGFFPVLLHPSDKELYPATWASDGGLWPPIIKTEWSCPSCSFREYSVRRPAQQGDDGNILKRMSFSRPTAAAELRLYASDDQLRRLASRVAEKIAHEGITREDYDRRWAEAQRSARERCSRRE